MQPHCQCARRRPCQLLVRQVLALCAGVLTVFAFSASEAATYTCSGGDVSCLIATINAANANGQVNTIRLAEGIYTLTAVDNGSDGPTGLPSVTSTLTIAGAGAIVTTVERAVDVSRFRIFHVGSEGVLTLRRMTIRGGDAQGFGGGAVRANGSVIINDAVIAGNRALGALGAGGVLGGNVVVTGTTVAGNVSSSSAHVHVDASGDLTIRNSTIAQNLGGAGVFFTSPGTLTIADTVISGNAGDRRPGGVWIGQSGAVATITNSTVSGNLAGDASGGGIGTTAGTTVTIDRSSIVDNVAYLRTGGGIAAGSGGTVIIRNSTVARNHAYINGSGLAIGSGAAVTVTSSTITANVTDATPLPAGSGISGPVRIENTLLARNKSAVFDTYAESNCAAPITSLGHNLISDPAGCGDLQSTDVVADPGIGAFIDPGRSGTGHYPLLAGSLAIDAGSDAACGRRDQRRLVRGIDGDADGVRGCDIGATEFYPVVNEWVQLDRVHATFVPREPAQTPVNPLAAGGSYHIDAVFTNIGGANICHVAFEVVTLNAPTGVASVLTRNGELIGREGSQFPATLVGDRANLQAGDRERYRFTIGVTEPAPLTFFVNLMGERTTSGCSR